MPRRTHIDPRNIEVIDDATADVLRRLTGTQRLEIASKIFATVRDIIRRKLEMEEPGWSDDRLKREAAKRILETDEVELMHWFEREHGKTGYLNL